MDSLFPRCSLDKSYFLTYYRSYDSPTRKTSPIMKLIVLDCDGVISKGEAQPFDLTLFARLAELNRRAKLGDKVPAVTLNTGRPSAYVEAVMQAIEGWQPALYENGAGMYFPQKYKFQMTPLLSAVHQANLQEVLQVIDRHFVQTGVLYWQPGKRVCHTLFAHPPHSITDFVPEIQATLKQISPDFVAVPAVLALNVFPAHITKGTGLQWLANVTNIDPADMAGVGDSASDVAFLRHVGRAAAPSNATPDVQAVVELVSTRENATGLLDILDHWKL